MGLLVCRAVRDNDPVSETISPPVKPADSTAVRVAEVLLAFGAAAAPMGITEVARATHLSKAVVHRIVQTLCTTDLLVQDAHTRKYQLGMAAFTLADTAAQTSLFRSASLDILATLAEQAGETTTLSGRIGHRRVYLAQMESRQLVRISVKLGAPFPLTVGASGAAILAHLPQAEAEAALHTPMERYSASTVTDPEQIRQRMRFVRENGFARTTGERVEDSTGFAAPVFNPAGEVLGAISIAALTSRLTPTRESSLATQVKEAAATLTTRLRDR